MDTKSGIDMNKNPNKVKDSQSDRVLQKNVPKRTSVHHCNHKTAWALGALGAAGEPCTGPQNMRRLAHLRQIITFICALATQSRL